MRARFCCLATGFLATFAAASLPGLSQAAVAAPVSIRDLVELTDIDSISVSPDGRFAVFRTERADVGRNSYILRWYSADLSNGMVRDIGSGGEPIYSDPGLLLPEKILWAPDDRTIIVRELADGVIGLWRGDVSGQGMTALVNGDANVIDYSIAPDGRSVTYHVGATRDAIRRAEQSEYDRGILVDATVDLAQSLFRGGSIDGRMASQRLVGYWWVRDGLLWRAPRQERRVDLATGLDVAVGEPQPVPPFELAKYLETDTASGNPAAPGSVMIGGKQHAVTVTFKNGRHVSCADPACVSAVVSSAVWRPGSRDLILTFKDRAFRQSLYRWNTDTNTLTLIIAAEGLLNGGRNDFRPCAVSANAAICVAAGSASPPRVEQVDLATGQRKLLFDPNGGLRANYQPKVRFMRWPIGDGREATGVVMQSAQISRTRAPLYLNYNRCEGFLRGGEGNEWPMPQLLEAGYVVACINSVPFDGPQDAIRNYEIGLLAVGRLVDRLANEQAIARSKVAMGGLSFGSEAAFWVAVHSHLLAALSVTAPQWEPASYWLSSMPGSDIPATVRRVWGYGPPDQTAKRWQMEAPVFNIDKLRIPVLFQMPESEARRVPELYARLWQQGTPTELYAFPDEAHIKIQPRHRLAVYERNLDWFRYWLEGYRDADLAKAEQYKRWDELRKRWQAPSAMSATTGATAPRQQSR